MKKFCVQSLIIGIGMGMIMTASFNFFLDARSVAPIIAAEELSELADTEIEKTIGYLKKNLESEKVDKEEIKEKEEASMQEEKMVENNNRNFQEMEQEKVRLVITSGMNTYAIASLLWKEGLISDTEEFVNVAIEKGYTKIFKVGKREISKNCTLEEILEILITKPE